MNSREDRRNPVGNRQEFFFFLMWTIFKVFIEFVLILLLVFYILGFFGPKACRIPSPWTGIEPAPLASEDKVLTIGPPDNSWQFQTRSCSLKILACSPWGSTRGKICCSHLAYPLRHDGTGASLQATHHVEWQNKFQPPVKYPSNHIHLAQETEELQQWD